MNFETTTKMSSADVEKPAQGLKEEKFERKESDSEQAMDQNEISDLKSSEVSQSATGAENKEEANSKENEDVDIAVIKKDPTDKSGNDKSKRKNLKCSKCDLVSNIVLLFYNVNCQHVLCTKCLQLLGHVTQLKCDTVLSNGAKCDALWTRKSTNILTYVDPLFINAVTVELKGNDAGH